MRRFIVLLGLLLLPAAATASAHYNVVQQVRVPGGTIEVLEDSRLTPAIQNVMWDKCTDISFLLDEHDPRLIPFRDGKVLPAEIRQTANRRVVTTVVPNAWAPIAQFEEKQLRSSTGDIFLLDTDDDACMGSYSGKGVFLYYLESGKLASVTASENGATTPIYLFRSLKSDWRIVTKKPNRIEIEQMLCRPDFAHETRQTLPFLLRYITFQFDGHKWTRAERIKPGSWEADEPFPRRSLFP